MQKLYNVDTGRPGEPAPAMFRASVTRELSRVEALLKVRCGSNPKP